MSGTQFDVAIVGGGIIGLMAAAEAGKAGLRAVLLEQHFPGTQEGSSAEHVRMWRTMYTERSHAILAYRAGEMFRDIEREGGQKILHQHGLLNFGVETDYTAEGTLLSAAKTLSELGKKVRMLSKKDIEREYPFKNLPENYVGVFQEDNAVIDVRSAIGVAGKICQSNGVTILPRHRVQKITNGSGGVELVVGDTAVSARKLIIATGAYTNELLRPNFGFELNLLIWDMCFAYYKLDGTRGNYPMWFQFDRAINGYSNLFYGFPDVSFGRPGFVRIAVDWASHTFGDVRCRRYSPPQIDLEIVREFVMDRMVGLDSAPVDTGRALMAHLPDNLSVLDYLPRSVDPYRNIVLCAAGWAFKFAPLFGRLCIDLAFDRPFDDDVTELRIERAERLRPIPAWTRQRTDQVV